MKIGIIGVGQWGKNLLRVFDGLAKVVWCSNRTDKATREWVKQEYPSVRVTFDYSEVLKDDSIEAVVIATPVTTHFSIAKQALKEGKHVFLEKPMTNTVTEAEELIYIAEQNKLVLFIGHIFLYHPVYKRIKELTSQDPVRQIHTAWNKFGTFKEDIVSNLVSHEMAIAIDLLQEPPYKIDNLYINKIISKSDIISFNIYFKGNKRGSININRVHPHKSHEIRIITENGRLHYWVDNQLFELNKKERNLKILFENIEEPLKTECAEFIKCANESKKPLTDGYFGLEVLKNLKSVKNML